MSDKTCAISIPGYRIEKDCTLLCREAKWTDFVIFYLGNYILHVATILGNPGASVEAQVLLAIRALLFPFAGLTRGVRAIKTQLYWGKTGLQTAARAKALRMVVPEEYNMGPRPIATRLEASIELSDAASYRDKGSPRDGERKPIPDSQSKSGPNERIVVTRRKPLSTFEKIRLHISDMYSSSPHLRYNEETTSWRRIKVHGQHKLPPGFELGEVPAYASFEKDEAPRNRWWQKAVPQETQLASNRNLVRIIASCVQVVFGVITLYRTRGLQIERFGYAAYGLTVFPYALMSLINLCANILQPDYPAMYIVDSQFLDTLRRDHPDTCEVTGTVGRLHEVSRDEPLMEDERLTPTFLLVVFALSLALCLAVIAGLTHFEKGDSTTAQRVWIMLWLVFSNFIGTMFGHSFDAQQEQHSVQLWIFSLAHFVYGAPAIGGLVVVGQMIMQYGTCEVVK